MVTVSRIFSIPATTQVQTTVLGTSATTVISGGWCSLRDQSPAWYHSTKIEVREAGFEPAAFWTQTRRATKLRYTLRSPPIDVDGMEGAADLGPHALPQPARGCNTKGTGRSVLD